LKLWGEFHEEDEDNLTSRDNETEIDQSNFGSFFDNKSIVSNDSSIKNGSPLKKSFDNSGVIVSNFDVMSKI